MVSNFYTKIFTYFWEFVLILFTLATIVGLVAIVSMASDIQHLMQKASFYVFGWLLTAIVIGALSILISMYNKLSKLVELQEKLLEQHSNQLASNDSE